MITLESLTKKFPDFELRDINLEVADGEYFVLLGKSGSGKSLILELIAGLQIPDSGKILIDSADCTNQKIQHRHVGIVFQNHCLFPHMNTYKNIYFSVNNRQQKKYLQKSINDITRTLNISDLLKRYPATLSAGEAQRVALARTLATNPRCLLLDEPLASLDSHMKSEVRSMLRKINRGEIFFGEENRNKKKTIIHVTHDYEEALALADRIAVMEDGIVSQIGLPQDIFQTPKSNFVAKFVGVKNFFKGKVRKGGDSCFFDVERPGLKSSNNISFYLADGSCEDKEERYISLRAEDITIANRHFDTSARNCFTGTIVDFEKIKTGLEVIVEAENSLKFFAVITELSRKELELFAGKKIFVSFKASALKII